LTINDAFNAFPCTHFPVSTSPKEYVSKNPGLTVLAGPTAVGKGTVSTYIRDNYPEVWLSVSATTRPPRPGEVDGVHYYFKSAEEFDELIEKGELLEWAVVHGRNRYGTLRSTVDAAIDEGLSVLLEIISRVHAKSRRPSLMPGSCSWPRRAGRKWFAG